MHLSIASYIATTKSLLEGWRIEWEIRTELIDSVYILSRAENICLQTRGILTGVNEIIHVSSGSN